MHGKLILHSCLLSRGRRESNAKTLRLKLEMTRLENVTKMTELPKQSLGGFKLTELYQKSERGRYWVWEGSGKDLEARS